LRRAFLPSLRTGPPGTLLCLCAEIEGTVDAAALRPALDQVRERHPLLQARIAHDEELGPALYKSGRPIELKMIYAGKDADWRRIVERELQRPIGTGSGALLRVTALRARDATTIVLTFQHAIAVRRLGSS
jgi:hypothetical protein